MIHLSLTILPHLSQDHRTHLLPLPSHHLIIELIFYLFHPIISSSNSSFTPSIPSSHPSTTMSFDEDELTDMAIAMDATVFAERIRIIAERAEDAGRLASGDPPLVRPWTSKPSSHAEQS
jgi:hypothetical protein